MIPPMTLCFSCISLSAGTSASNESRYRAPLAADKSANALREERGGECPPGAASRHGPADLSSQLPSGIVDCLQRTARQPVPQGVCFQRPLGLAQGDFGFAPGVLLRPEEIKANLSEGSAREGTSLHGGSYAHISETRRELWDRANLEQEELRFWVRAFA